MAAAAAMQALPLAPFTAMQGASHPNPVMELMWYHANGEQQKNWTPLPLVATALQPVQQEAPAQLTDQFSSPRTKMGTNVYISRLPRTITQEQLEKLFQGFGPIISCRVVYHTQGKQGRVPRDPVGFVQFLSPDVAQTAINQTNGMLYEGKRLVVRLADQDKDKGITSAPCDNLYIANLPKHFKEPELFAIFAPYGQIEELVVLKHLATGQSKGSGMVRFATMEEATRARDALNCARLPDLEYPLEVKFAESKQDKLQRQRQKLSAQRASNGDLGPGLPAAPLERQSTPLASSSTPASPCGLLFPAKPPLMTPQSARSLASPQAAKSPFEEYLRTVLPQTPATPMSGCLSRTASVWDPKPGDFVDGSLDSDPWEKNTYGYSSDSNSDGVPGTPSSHSTALTLNDPWSTTPRKSAPHSFTLPVVMAGSQPLSPQSGPQAASPIQRSAGASPFGSGIMSPLTLGTPPDAPGEALQWGTLIHIRNLPPGTSQLHLYQLCARFGAILRCTLTKEEGGTVAAWLAFKKAEEAAQVELKLDGFVLQGRKLQVQLC